jgi:F0F1-type ATP synthase assembly protein I
LRLKLDPNWAKSIGLLTTTVTTLVGYVGAGTGLGYLIGKKWGAAVGSMLGLVGAMVQLVRLAQKLDEENQKDSDDK